MSGSDGTDGGAGSGGRTGGAVMADLLIGGAVGDALGAPVEFLQREAILRAFGPDGIRAFAPAYGRLGAITDDTQMTLFTLDGLIEAALEPGGFAADHAPAAVHAAYGRWYETQGTSFPGPNRPARQMRLMGERALWSQRAPGLTCLSSLAQPIARPGTPAVNRSKGAGGLMRVAPVGLVAEDAFTLGAQTAALTHGHPTGWVAAGAFAAFIRALALGSAVEAAIDAVRAGLDERLAALGEADPSRTGFAETLAAVDAALAAPTDLPDAGTLGRLGEGWIAEEALAMAFWVLRTGLPPLEALQLAVNITGDSDTLGILVGQALGVSHGTGWIPADWLDQLELADLMTALAEEAGACLPIAGSAPRAG